MNPSTQLTYWEIYPCLEWSCDNDELKDKQDINTLIAVLPFVLVALSELTKIPIAGAAYYARSRTWKYLLSFSLVFLAIITFETALNGFERNYSQLNYALDAMRRDYSAVDDKINFIEGERVIASELTVESIESRFNGDRPRAISSAFTNSRICV